MASSFAVLAMPHFVAAKGISASPGGGGGQPFFTQGMIEPFTGLIAPFGAPRAGGQLLSLDENSQMLFSLYGTNFGGDGVNSFALPNLEGLVAVGGSPVGQKGQQTLALTWLIAAGKSDSPFPGIVIAFGGSFAPDGWLVADGSLLPISAYPALFEAIGTTYGGDGVKDFALPNLKGAAPVGAGEGPGLPPVELGQKVSGQVPGLGLNYLICTMGAFPSFSGDWDVPSCVAYIGQVVAYAGAKVPEIWALCDGALLQIRTHSALFSMVGNSYGGDGRNDFTLPDLRGRMLVSGSPGQPPRVAGRGD